MQPAKGELEGGGHRHTYCVVVLIVLGGEETARRDAKGNAG